MSLIRQIWSLLLGTLVLALLGGMLVNIASARDSLQTELRFKNSENAQLLSLALGQQRGNMGAMQGLLATQFETGSYRSIRLRLADGTAVFARTRDREPALAPSWFVQLLAIESPPGVARVDAGWAWPGSIEVVSDATFGYDDLWRGAWRSLVWLLVVAAASGLVAWTAVRRIRTTLDAAIEQAQALAEGRYITVEEPDVPELRRLCDAMNMTVQRSRALFEAQATQLEALRRQAHCDPMTGLPHRANFMAGLAAFLQRQDRLDGVGLVLVRVADLAGLNLLLGRDSADRALMLVARALQTYPERVQGCFVGRLNGSDFALCLPMRNAAAETARSLAAVLRAGLNTLGSAVHAHLGAVEIHGESSVANLMANADLALARAESRGPFAVELVTEGDAPTPRGEQAWREQLAKALASGDVELGTYPVLDRREQLIHLECLLRVRLDPEQPRETGARWLPLAVRSRLTAHADARALQLALRAIADDGLPRAVNLASSSLGDGGFATHVLHMLQESPHLAQKLWVEFDEAAAVSQFDTLQEFGRLVRPMGVRFGLEHAGQRLHAIDRLFELGLDYVKLEASMCRGVAGNEAAQEFVRRSVALLHALSMLVIAQGVLDPADVEVLWSCGVDGATGPWANQKAPA